MGEIYTTDKVYRLEISRKSNNIFGNNNLISNIKIFDTVFNRLVFEINLSIEETIKLLDDMYSFMVFGGYRIDTQSNQYYDFGKIHTFLLDIDKEKKHSILSIYDYDNISGKSIKRISLNFSDESNFSESWVLYDLFFEIYSTCLYDIIDLEDFVYEV